MGKNVHNVVEYKDIKELLRKTGEMYADRPAFKYKTDVPDKFRIITHKEFRDDIDSLGTALINLGLKGKKIAVISENRYEWCVAYLAACCGTGIVVPLDRALPENEINSLIERSKVEAIFYSGKYDEIIEKIKKQHLYNLKYFISMEKEDHEDGINSEKKLIEEGRKLIEEGNRDFLDAEIDPEKMGIMLFTSGTTAMSKAVMLSHKNICTNIKDITYIINLVKEDTMLSFLPLHHTFECTVGFLYPISRGCSIAFCDGIRHIAENVKEYRISAMISVPILYENMYKKVIKGIEKQGKLEKVKKGIKISNFLLKFHIDIRKKIFKDIHAILGGNVRLFVSGAAALDPEVEKGFNDLGFRTLQGYGLTETSPVIAAENDKYIRIGSVGKVVPSLDVRIDNKNEQGIGEIVVKGPSVMLGYYQNEEATNESIKDGWFNTGDLGYFDKDNYLYITGRKKNVIVQKNGKNIYPEELENLINHIEGVKECMVYGKLDSDNDMVICAKIVYDKEVVKEKYNADNKDKIYDALLKEIKKINKTMPAYKYVREITVTEEELIKTTTQKVKRHEELAKIEKEK